MTAPLEGRLERWVEAGVLEPSAAERILAWEGSHGGASSPSAAELRWPVRLVGLGGLLVAAGILQFVAAHWDALSPGARFVSVLATVAGLKPHPAALGYTHTENDAAPPGRLRHHRPCSPAPHPASTLPSRSAARWLSPTPGNSSAPGCALAGGHSTCARADAPS